MSSYDKSVRQLKTWLKSRGFRLPSHLDVLYYEGSGYGIMSRKAMDAGETIFRLPESLLITRKLLKTSVAAPIVNKWGRELSSLHCLVIWLLVESCLPSSPWSPYIHLLPNSFSTPAFCPPYLISRFSRLAQEAMREHRHRIKTDFEKLRPLLLQIQVSNSFCHTFSSYKLFRWAWTCVNTRSVSMPPDQDMALAPFLDFLNHDCHPQVVNGRRSGFNEEGRCYEVVSANKVQANSQVFISYGYHSNLTLAVEYGFVLPSNPQSTVKFNLDELISCMETNVDKKVINKLISQQFHLDLCVTCKGASWCLIHAATALTANEAPGLLKKLYEKRMQENRLVKRNQFRPNRFKSFVNISSMLVEEESNLLSSIKLF